MRILIIIFFAGIFFSYGQTRVLDQEYYFIVKNKTLEFKQIKDSLFITKCSGIKKCDSLAKFSYLIERDSIIDYKSKMIFLKGYKYKHRNTKIHEKKMILISLENGRKEIEESYSLNGNDKVLFPTLYPKSEIIDLKPISQISESESKEILTEFVDYIKSFDKGEFDFDDYKVWVKFNDIVMNKGYNPIGAEREVGFKSD